MRLASLLHNVERMTFGCYIQPCLYSLSKTVFKIGYMVFKCLWYTQNVLYMIPTTGLTLLQQNSIIAK